MSELSDIPALALITVPSAERLDQIDHISLVCDHLSQLYLSQPFSDITLVVEGQRLPALRAILAVRSLTFLELLYDGQNEKPGKEFTLEKIPSLESFQHLLKYIYSGRLEIKDLAEEI